MGREVKPLYRKVNSKARWCHHQSGPDAKHDRNTKQGIQRSMKKGVKRGLDYTPLYKFLLSKIGEDWTKVHSEAISRLDHEDPIFYMVAKNDAEKNDYVFCGTNACYSGLYVDADNKIQKVNPALKNEDFYPACPCCTHTFNGTTLQHTHNDYVKKQSIDANFKDTPDKTI